MRELDRNSVYFDRAGLPLVGRVNFYTKGTTTRQNVYGSDGTAISNPMFTSTGKLSPQVFLGDSDYTITWEEYVGEGTMSSDDESESWMQVGSCISLKPTVSLTVENAGLVCCDKVSDLRALDPEQLEDHLTVTLLGYSAAGDKPSVNYLWTPGITVSDNGGSYIVPTGYNSGAYVLVNDGDIDIRHFGVFPKASQSATTSQDALQFQVAHAYAVTKNVALILPDRDGAIGYYLVPSGTYTRIVCENSNAMVISGTSGTVTINQYKDRPFYVDRSATGYIGTFTFVGSHLEQGFDVTRATGITWTVTGEFLIDNATQTNVPSSFTDTEVKFASGIVSTKGYSFTRCKIQNGKLDADYSYNFTEMAISDLFLTDPDETIGGTFTDCTADVDDFVNIANWVTVKQYQGDSDFDFKGKSMSSFSLGSALDYRIYNADITTLTIASTVTGRTLKFYNSTVGSVTCAGTGNLYEFHDCDLGGFAPSDGRLLFFGTAVNGAVGSTGVTRIDAKSSSFGSSLTGKILDAESCVFTGAVTVRPSANTFTANFVSCEFNAGLVLSSDVGTTNTVYMNLVSNNFKTSTISVTGGSIASTGNTCGYVGNKFLTNDVWVQGTYSVVEGGTNILANFPAVQLFGFNSNRVRFSLVLEYHTDLVSSSQYSTEKVVYMENVTMAGVTNTSTFARSTGYDEGSTCRPDAVWCHVVMM